MKKLVLGSLNIDRTYRVENLVKPKETIAAKKYESFCGGKGFNQAVALARAGSQVYFAGVIGSDGEMLLKALEENRINTNHIMRSETSNGHAIIQVDDKGQNCIIIVSGSNGEVTEEYISQVLSDFSEGDLVVLQNEISCVGFAIQEAKRRGLIIAFNPSPFNDAIQDCDLSHVDVLLVNEVEGAALCGCEDENRIFDYLGNTYPGISVVLTKGEEGSSFLSKSGDRYYAQAASCDAVDTTAAGDTFTGYFLETLFQNCDPNCALQTASVASGISVTRKGASSSIPKLEEVIDFMKK